jgi:iron complex transport system ATP-binding protein
VTTPVVLEGLDLTVGYVHRHRTSPILEGVSLRLHEGELVCLLGPNGAGKSTLLRTLIGAQPPLAGTVRLEGADVAEMTPRERARYLSVVLTDRIEVGYLDVRSLVGFGRTPHLGWFTTLADHDREIVSWALDAAGATDLADRMVHELSDGERQRAMIARALAQQPRVLVLDEPTAFLDVTRRVELVALLQRLTATTGLAVLMSTHEVELAIHAADAVWLVQADGTYDAGGPEDLALDDRLHRAFTGREVMFDRRTGSFVVNRSMDHPPRIVIHGDDELTGWAERAVRRAGWMPSSDAAVSLHLHFDGAVAAWRCAGPARAAEGRTLAALVAHLRRPPDATDPPPTDHITTGEHRP